MQDRASEITQEAWWLGETEEEQRQGEKRPKKKKKKGGKGGERKSLVRKEKQESKHARASIGHHSRSSRGSFPSTQNGVQPTETTLAAGVDRNRVSSWTAAHRRMGGSATSPSMAAKATRILGVGVGLPPAGFLSVLSVCFFVSSVLVALVSFFPTNCFPAP